MFLKRRKASLELSVRAIVIVVLAMTLLGLGLGFIKNMFGEVSQLSDTTFAQITDQVQKDLVSTNERLLFSQTKVNIERGKSSLLGWGIKNEGNTQLRYWVEFRGIQCPDEFAASKSCNDLPNFNPPTSGTYTAADGGEINNKWFIFKYNPSGDEDLLYSIEPATHHVRRVDLNIPSDAQTGLYLIDLSVYDKDNGNAKYASTEIFIRVG
jgi:hypothetical protein